MMKLEKIGTIRREFCSYDDKEHETILNEYLVRVSGKTYPHRFNLMNNGFYYDDIDKCWYKSIETEDEINTVYKYYKSLGLSVALKPIYRINDLNK